MVMRLEQGTLGTMRLALLPLKNAGAQIAADMQAAGTGKRCGVCGKPFDRARKWRSLARLVYGGDVVLMVAWKLCGKCSHEAKRNGGKVPACLIREAESVCEVARFAAACEKGTA